MEMIGTPETYLEAMEASLERKGRILDRLYELSQRQDEVLQQEEFDMVAFGKLMDEKQKELEQIQKLDAGFEQIYLRIKEALGENAGAYREPVRRLQAKIRKLTEAGVELEAMELRNQQKLDRRLAASRSKIKSYKVNNRAAAHYYKSMSDQHPGESIFLDKKK